MGPRNTVRRRPTCRRQSGVALITVLLVVALAATAAASMTGQHQLDLRRTGNRIALAQAHEIALGGEAWARGILWRDRRGEARGSAGQGDPERPDAVDAGDENWARDLPPIPIEGGQVAGAIDDMQGRFNVNNLVDGDQVDALALARFERLLAALDIDRAVAQAVIDWIDRDGETSFPGGAEDDFYATLDAPYRAANRPLAGASELRLVRGMTPAAWRRLAPHVAALPAPTAINVNTATAAVLRALVPGLEAAAAEELAKFADAEPFFSVDAFRDNALVAQAGEGDDADDGEPGGGNERLAVGSSHFRVRTDVRIGDIEYTLYSWLARNDNGASRVLRRGRTPN